MMISRVDLLRKLADVVNHILICCVVHENVYGAHFRDCFLDEICAILLLGEVCWE